jgi:hypothetical protein
VGWDVFARIEKRFPLPLRISANVTGDFGNVTDFGRALGCAEKIVGMEWIRAGLEPPRFMLMGA